MLLPVYLEFAKFSERKFGGMPGGQAASEGTIKKEAPSEEDTSLCAG